jgi:PAS domain S-box-containing protein
MIHSLKNLKTLIRAIFGSLLFFVFVIAPVSFFSIFKLHQTTKDLYLHPFQVHSASLHLKNNLLVIRDKMLETGLVRDRFKIGQLAYEIDILDKLARANLEDIKAGFLGDKSLLEQMESSLDEWKERRQIIFNYAKLGEFAMVSAQVMGDGRNIYKKVEAITDEIENFSRNKALWYVEESSNVAVKNYYIIGSLFICLIIVIILSGFTFYKKILALVGQEKGYVEAITSSEYKFRNLFDSSADCILIIDSFGIIIDINKKGYQRLGYEKNELIGRHISTLVSTTFRNSVPDRIARVKQEGFHQFESEHVCKDGSVFPIEVVVNQIDCNGHKCFFSVNREITNRKQMEKTINENIARYKAVIETSREGFLILNLQGEILEVNDSYLKLSGYTRDEIMIMRYWDLTARENLEQSMGRIHRIFKNGYDQFETFHETKDRKIWPVEVSANFWEENDNLIFMFVRDVTVRKAWVNQLEENERKFRVLFENANDELMILNSEGIILDINYNGHYQLGYTREEMVGKKIGQFISEDSVKESTAVMEKLYEQGQCTFEAVNIRKDGTGIPLEVNAQVLEQGGEKLIFSIARDISTRKEFEELISFREAKYRAVTETSQDGFWIIDPQGNILEVNDSYLRHSGYTREELVGKNYSITAPRLNQDERKAHMQLVKDKKHDRFESYHVRKDGSKWPVEVNTNYWDLGGGLWFAFITDITERKEAFNRLHDSEDKFRTLFENANDGMHILDMNARIVDINSKGCSRLGYTKDEMIGRPITDFVPEDAPSRDPGIIKKILDQGHLTFESAHVRKDGKVIPMEINAKMIEQAGQKYFFSVNRDISLRKELEEVLIKREAKYRAIIETSVDGFWIADNRGKIIEVNDAYVRQSGYSRDELLQMSIPDVEAKETSQETAAHIEEIIKTGNAKFETVHKRKDGQTWPVEIHTTFHNINNGLFFVFIHDIRARKMYITNLKESEYKFRMLFENNNDYLVLATIDGIILDMNPLGIHNLGYERDEVIGKPLQKIIAPKFSDEMAENTRKISEGSVILELIYVHKNGTEIPVEANISVIEKGDEKYHFSLARDIVQRRKELEIMQNREAISRAVIERLLDS